MQQAKMVSLSTKKNKFFKKGNSTYKLQKKQFIEYKFLKLKKK